MDNLIPFLGLMNKAGKLAIGEEPVGTACRAKRARLIIMASDAASNTQRRAAHFAQAGQCPCITIPLDKGQLGNALGRSSCAMAAISDVGFAAALMKKLAPSDPDAYGSILEALDQKAAKTLQRQKEQRAHEKNLQRGKKKPWAFQPERPKE